MATSTPSPTRRTQPPRGGVTGNTNNSQSRIQQWQEETDFSEPPVNHDIIRHIYSADIATLKSILEEAQLNTHTPIRYLKRLWRTYSLLREWGSYHSVSSGALDRSLRKSTDVHENTVGLLAGIGEILSSGKWISLKMCSSEVPRKHGHFGWSR